MTIFFKSTIPQGVVKIEQTTKLQEATFCDDIGGAMNTRNVEGLRPDPWRKHYEAVLLEFDPAKLTNLVAFAETAIFFRLQRLPKCRETQQERRAIEDAVSALYTIKKEILKFPGLDLH